MKRINSLIIFIYSVLFIFIISVPVFAEGTNEVKDIPRIEVVSSIPVETSLKGAGTRRASVVWIEMIESAKRSLDFADFYIISEKNEPLELSGPG